MDRMWKWPRTPGPGQVTLIADYVKGAGRFEVGVHSAPEMWVWRVERIMNWALA